MWLAGGGIRSGITHGATDEFGYAAVDDVVHVNDLHATMLHLLGIDHQRFAVRHQGLDMRLTGVEQARGKVIITSPQYVQIDPREIESLLARLDGGADFATPWRRGLRKRTVANCSMAMRFCVRCATS